MLIFNKSTMAQDFKSGFFVFLLALPLCLGISIASGFPPVAGIFTAVVGGILSSFLGSSRLTIKGPAAGLIVIVIGAVTELGMGDPILGYKRTLAVAVLAAVIQIIFGFSKAGIIGEIIPKSVVHGMLCAIGVIIIAKQCHLLLGVIPLANSPLALLGEFPSHILGLNPQVSIIAALTLMLLIFWPKMAPKASKIIPAAILALTASMLLGAFFDFDHAHDYKFLNFNYHVDPSLLINLPSSFFGAFTFPDFSAISSFISIKYIVMLSLVGSIESLLTVNAVDSMDPEKKNSDLNKDLIATGFGNLVAALVGGLPMISEIVRSRANIDNGAKSAQSNFFHGFLLLISVALFPNILHMIPATTLAAMLVFTGFRLASPSEFSQTYKIGMDQFAPFMMTFIITLSIDLLLGVIAGVVTQLLINLYNGLKISDLFNVKHHATKNASELKIKVFSPVGFTNSYQLKKTLEEKIPENSKIVVDFSESRMVEHTCFQVIESLSKNHDKVLIEVTGLQGHDSASTHEQATKILRKIA
jgi:MFS superfamily sulfate permease-like transporter